MPAAFGDAAAALLREMHRTIARVTDDLEKFGFNRAVARIREFVNSLSDFTGDDAAAAWARRQGLETIVKLIGPMMPHLAEELWQRLGGTTLLAHEPWPAADPAWLAEDEVTLSVQVNGKLRGTLVVAKDAAEAEATAAAAQLPAVIAAIAGKPARKVIFVANRIVNFVV